MHSLSVIWIATSIIGYCCHALNHFSRFTVRCARIHKSIWGIHPATDNTIVCDELCSGCILFLWVAMHLCKPADLSHVGEIMQGVQKNELGTYIIFNAWANQNLFHISEDQVKVRLLSPANVEVTEEILANISQLAKFSGEGDEQVMVSCWRQTLALSRIGCVLLQQRKQAVHGVHLCSTRSFWIACARQAQHDRVGYKLDLQGRLLQ